MSTVDSTDRAWVLSTSSRYRNPHPLGGRWWLNGRDVSDIVSRLIHAGHLDRDGQITDAGEAWLTAQHANERTAA